ncbi:MAG: chloride channel protein [Anaerovoracaceae bacterium]|jgi:H+/Cl- antiporter ClcA
MTENHIGRKLRRGQKAGAVAGMALYALVFGAAAGAIVWAFLRVLGLGIDFIWATLPQWFDGGAVYTAAVCIGGGAVIGLFQRRFGIWPDTMEEVMGKLKRDGTYPWRRLHIILIAVLMPLLFGGTLGPEAGLTGIITALCCMTGDALKYKTAELRELAEAGMAATLGVIFNAPFFGFVNNFEHSRAEEKRWFSPREFRLSRAVVYAAGIAGGFATLGMLRHLFGGGLGLPRLKMDDAVHGLIGLNDWKWFPVYAGCGLLLGLFYLVFSKLTSSLAGLLAERRVLCCMIAGACLALLGIWNPLNMFSGEAQLTELAASWQTIPVTALVLTAITKLLATNICLSFGWKGGSIFPIIYCGVSLGFGLAALTGGLPIFAVAVSAAATYGYIVKKPLTVVAILFLCFPLRLFIPLAAAAYLGSLIPSPWVRKKADGGKKRRLFRRKHRQ